MKPIMHHIPICPFSQRVEILLELKGLGGEIDFEVVDITVARSPHLLKLTGGSTVLPVLEFPDGRPCLRGSLVLLNYFEDLYAAPLVRRDDPWERAIENLLVAMEGPFVNSGYVLVLNQDQSKRDGLVNEFLSHYGRINDLLCRYSRGAGPWLFEKFGWAETVYAPFFRRFDFVDYYEDVDLPETEMYTRVREWRDACLSSPAAKQVGSEEVIKLYYDYARGAGNGALLPGRSRSSFAFEPLSRITLKSPPMIALMAPLEPAVFRLQTGLLFLLFRVDFKGFFL